MKNWFFLSLLAGLVVFSACEKEEEHMHMHTGDEPDYHIHVNAPNSDDKHVGNTIALNIEFEDHNGGVVHHVNVRIYNVVTGEEIYNAPAEAHVHATEGSYTLEDELVLNVDAHTDWMLEARVWGHDAGSHEKKAEVPFHVHP